MDIMENKELWFIDTNIYLDSLDLTKNDFLPFKDFYKKESILILLPKVVEDEFHNNCNKILSEQLEKITMISNEFNKTLNNTQRSIKKQQSN